MTKDFEALYGQPVAVRASAPGRVNLIGEHTDYNGGYVLPIALPQKCHVELAPRADRLVRAWSEQLSGNECPRGYALGAEARVNDWLDYVQAVTATLEPTLPLPRGFDLRIRSDLPIGSGLASSAALQVSILRALRAAFRLQLEDVELARLAQRAENDFVGARVGIMDQLAACLAAEDAALFIDTRSLAWERVPMPNAAELVVIDAGVAHGHAGGAYNTRRAECDRAAALLAVPELRDVSITDLGRVDQLPMPLDRRARHVVLENARVVNAVAALRAGDLAKVGALLYEGHASLRDDYEVSIPELDLLVELAEEEPDIWGARLTGGGFGGSVVMLARRGRAWAAAQTLAQRYAVQSSRRPTILVPLVA